LGRLTDGNWSGPFDVLPRQLIKQNNIEQRLMHLDAVIEVDEAGLTKSIRADVDKFFRQDNRL
jgi:hypothetical protein